MVTLSPPTTSGAWDRDMKVVLVLASDLLRANGDLLGVPVENHLPLFALPSLAPGPAGRPAPMEPGAS